MGYWLKFSSETKINFFGAPIRTMEFPINKGWNIIGSLNQPVSVLSIASVPPHLITSQFFGYSDNYFIADSLLPGKGYWVKVNQPGSLILTNNGNASPGSAIIIQTTAEMPPPAPIEKQTTLLPKIFELEQNYPNPFNPTTTFRYALPTDSKVTLKVYNVLGQVVASLTDGVGSAGYQSVEWNASNVASGLYFYRIEATSISNPSKMFTQVKKMVLLK